MKNIYLDQLPDVNPDDVKPKHNGDEIIKILAKSVKALREADNVDGIQQMKLELMYSLAIYLRDKK